VLIEFFKFAVLGGFPGVNGTCQEWLKLLRSLYIFWYIHYHLKWDLFP